MSDQTGTAPTTELPGVEVSEANGQPDVLTRSEVERMVKEAEDKAFQRAQSLFDKGQGKVSKELKELQVTLDNLKAHGVEVPPEKVRAMQDEAIRKAFVQDEPAPPANGKTPTPAQPGQAAANSDPVTAEAWAMMQKAGVVIEDSDPEAATLDQSSPYAFLKSIDAAIIAKQQRLLAQGKPAEVRLPGQSGGSPGASVASLQAQLQELQRNPTQNMQKIREVSAQLRKALTTS